MLYVTTRGKNDAFTAYRTMNQDRGPDGGLFIPMRMPVFTREEIAACAEKSFGQNVADVLNVFFATKLTGWDVDMTIGRNRVQFKNMNRRITIAELWHNADNCFSRCIRSLADRLHPDGEIIGAHSNWVEIAVRIAVLFGIFGELLRTQQMTMDSPVNVAVASGSFAAPMAVWYGRQLGLPIGTIICGCNENSAVWDLLHRGEVDTDTTAVVTSTPDCDYALPPDLERLIYGTCGQEETMRYCWNCTEGGIYIPSEEDWEKIRQGMFAAVVSGVRVDTIIPSVYRTNQYILDPYAALAYGALSDYRARTGTGTATLLLSDKSPLFSAELVAKKMQITVSELKRRLSEA